MVLQKKLWVFLKQKQPKIILNYRVVGKNQENRIQNSEDNIIKDIGSLFKLKKENEVIKDGIIRDIKKLFELEEDY